MRQRSALGEVHAPHRFPHRSGILGVLLIAFLAVKNAL